MAARATPLRMTVEEYFAFDAEAPEGMRYEYWDGLVIPVHGYDPDTLEAMAGASPEHNQITVNLAVALYGPMTARGCRSGTSDQRVRMEAGRYGYPDVVFTCDEPVYSDDTPPILENPTLLIEVTSDTTVSRDRSRKLHAYTQIESLREYWIVEQDEAAATRFVRRGDVWELAFVRGLDATIESEALTLRVPMEDVYRLVLVE